MMDKPIQVQFGENVIGLFAGFARADLKPVPDLEADEFSHVSDDQLRRGLAKVFYGARWMYKLGLALLARDEERAAHIRSQIVDYTSVCEALLSYCVGHAIASGYTVGQAFRWKDPDKQTQPLKWAPSSIDHLLSKQSLWWLVRIGCEFGVISVELAKELQWLRIQRNAVHIRERTAIGAQAYLNQSRKAFELVNRTIVATKKWRAKHP